MHNALQPFELAQFPLAVPTITGCWEDDPSADYLDVLREGSRETTGWDDAKIDEYLRKFI